MPSGRPDSNPGEKSLPALSTRPAPGHSTDVLLHDFTEGGEYTEKRGVIIGCAPRPYVAALEGLLAAEHARTQPGTRKTGAPGAA